MGKCTLFLLVSFLLILAVPSFGQADLSSGPGSAAPGSSKWQKTIYYENKIPLVIDYEKAVIHTPGRDIPFINDGIMTDSGWRPLTLAEMQSFLQRGRTAWMFSTLRDNYSLDWDKFYALLNHNEEDPIWGGVFPHSVPYTYAIDEVVIELFGKSSVLQGYDMVKSVWEYDGPDGPGWGVREWPDRGWYADLTAALSVSNQTPFVGDTITASATIYNSGVYKVLSVPVRLVLTKEV